jgi:predicted molibdopterin-dependent oxidoreductase YjgC
MPQASNVGRLTRLDETHRKPVTLYIDDQKITALTGDTLLVAILVNTRRLRISEFGDGTRAGFCLMGACQDCWVWDAAGDRLRACSTTVESDMRIVTKEPEGLWPRRV